MRMRRAEARAGVLCSNEMRLGARTHLHAKPGVWWTADGCQTTGEGALATVLT